MKKIKGFRDYMEKTELFEKTKPSKALLIMAAPTMLSQAIVLIYNLADTWFIGRTNNPHMVGASSIAVTLYLAAVALSNVFGVGGGSLMVRLIGEKKEEEARKTASYSVAMAAIWAFAFSMLMLIFMNPVLHMLGANENTYVYARQYVLTTTVIGCIPTVLSMCMSQLLRNCGYSKEAGIGVAIGSLLNVALDPLFMFVILPKGKEVLGAGIATMLSNFVSLAYFIIKFYKLRDKTVLVLPKRVEKLEKTGLRSLYMVGVPAAFSIFLFDLVTIVINRLTVDYGPAQLAGMGIVLKVERIPINIGLGVCLGMVPLIAYNYGSGDLKRMKRFFSLARIAIVGFSLICVALYWIFANQIIGGFIKNSDTIIEGARILRGRCFSLPFMMIGYHIVNYMNAVNKGPVSFLLAIIRHIVLLIPIMLIMNAVWGFEGLIWSQLVADVLNSIVSMLIYKKHDVTKGME